MPRANRSTASVHALALIGVVLLAVAPDPCRAATCVWNSASGNFNTAANWTGCADLPGPSTRSPGVTDIALIANGTAQLNTDQTVAELELGTGGLLSVVGSNLPAVTVSGALRLNGGGTTTVLGTNQLRLVLPVGATGTLLAPSTLNNASFLENRGSLNLGSAVGVALTLSNAARIDNLAGGLVTFAGGNSRLDMFPGTGFENHDGGTVTVSGNLQAGPPTPQTNPAYLRNDGNMTVTGPGTLTIRGSGNGGTTRFDQSGSLTIGNATVVCRNVPNECVWSDANGSDPIDAITTLDGGTIDCGGSTIPVTITQGATIRGAGTLNCGLALSGLLAPGAPGGAPYGTLNVSGGVMVGPGGAFDFDLGGNGTGNYDRVVSGGNCSVGSSSYPDGLGTLTLRLASGYAPPLGEALPVFAYTSIEPQSAFNRVDFNGALDYAARFDPTQLVVFPAPRLTFEDASLIEGNSGSAIMSFTLRLSQPSALTVTAQVRETAGTATVGMPPSGDYTAGFQNISFAPGQVTRTAVATIYGDTLVEAEQSFTMAVNRYQMQNAALGSGLPGRLSAVGTILTDDLAPGTRYVLVAGGQGPAGVRRLTSTGLFLDVFPTGLGAGLNNPNTGVCFSPDGKVLATRFGQNTAGARLFSRHGGVLVDDFGASPGLFFNSHESCVYDAAGNVYIGQAGISGSTDASVPVLKFGPTGILLDSFVLPTGTRGTDWIELSADQCTLYYTSEDTAVRRYNLCTRTPLAPLITTLTPPFCYALRLRPNSELMVACQDAVHRVSAQGANLMTYTRQSIGETNAQGLFALNLDPDGTSFWTAGALSGMVYRVDIASGAVLTAFASGASGGASGLAVYDELSETDVLLADGFESTPSALKSVRAPHDPDKLPTGPDLPHYIPLGLTPPSDGD